MQRIVVDFGITKIINHTPNIKELVLSTTSENFQFRAGQFVMLHVPTKEKPVLRAYSIASSHHIKNKIHLIFKFVPNGLASTYVWGLMGNETLKFTGPFGKLYFQTPPTEQIIFLNTGSGLAQHYCYITSHLEELRNIKIRMLFGLNNENEIYYSKELDRVKKELPHFSYEYVLSSPTAAWTGKKGYVQHFISNYNYLKTPTTFYLCGNSHMIKDTKKILIEEQNFDKTKIWAESFD